MITISFQEAKSANSLQQSAQSPSKGVDKKEKRDAEQNKKALEVIVQMENDQWPWIVSLAIASWQRASEKAIVEKI